MKYGAILIDPPWRFETWSAAGRGRCPDGKRTNAIGNFTDGPNNAPERHYSTMSRDDILGLPVGDVAAKDSVLFLWAVDSLLPFAFECGAAWGFSYKTVAFYWAKTRRADSTRGNDLDDPTEKIFPMGTGYWTRSNPETCLLFTKGKPKRKAANIRKLLVSPRREHSRKPDEIYSRVERLVDGPYLEMFARQQWPGWDSWGNETTKFSATDPFS